MIPAGGAPRWPVVLFDFDGTLVDSIALIMASFRHALAEDALAEDAVAEDAVDEAELRSWIGRPLQLLMAERRPGREEAGMAAYRAFYAEHHDAMIAPIDGVPDLLAALDAAGVRTGVVSSKRADFIELGLRTLGLTGAVDVVVSQTDTVRHKPDPEPLRLAAERLGVDPADCVYVGDAVVDLQSGQGAGMATVGVSWGAGVRAELVAAAPVAVVDDVAALRALLLP